VIARDLQSIVAADLDRGLTAYDAAYLDCASRKGFALATLDEKLRQACLLHLQNRPSLQLNIIMIY
jgi:predicted nucleic acid-binding protein